MSQRLYLENLHVGQRFVSNPRQVTAEEIKAFAAEFDPQPFHLDEDAAKRSLFKGLAASGWHTAAMSMRMLVDCVPLADGLVGAELQLAWPKPTRPGMTLQLSSEVLDIVHSRSKPNMAIVTVRNETRDQDGELVQVFTVKMPVFKRPGE
ncbi:MaoC family dehydratase [Sphingomonas sp. URHD0057]|uniref:MaoC family dehydratase n=1 Tax=Sphingomonas sp. URHD0057 TaxID=1380389 RepID=UPI00048EE205|nr:MaoC family dehydratase [Sphingomonas sp. URHD0057]